MGSLEETGWLSSSMKSSNSDPARLKTALRLFSCRETFVVRPEVLDISNLYLLHVNFL